MAEERVGAVDYPPPPWSLVGQLWLSLFRLPRPVDRAHPPGMYGAAFVTYEPGSALTYAELLVARPVRDGSRRRVSVTDIWVDSPASLVGGRELWAVPKQRCGLQVTPGQGRPLARTTWSAGRDREPIANATFTDLPAIAPRLPFTLSTWQPGLDDTGGEERVARLRGSARALPCRGRWGFAGDGPLAWLRDARQLASFRLADFRMTFG